jgi:uncharacterized protein involved in copper resistance
MKKLLLSLPAALCTLAAVAQTTPTTTATTSTASTTTTMAKPSGKHPMKAHHGMHQGNHKTMTKSRMSSTTK